MKKQCLSMLLSILLLFVIAISPLSTNSVKANVTNNEKPKHHMKAYLKNEQTNKKIDLPVEVIEDSENTFSAEVKVTDQALAVTSTYEGRSVVDATGGLTLTITEYFSESYVGGWTGALDYGTAVWTRSDSQLTVKTNTARLWNSVCAHRVNGGQLDCFRDNNHYNYLFTPLMGQTWRANPSFRGTWYTLDSLGYFATHAESTILRIPTGTTWFLGFCVSQGGGEMVDCY
jgi:hypothetical protein